MPIDWPDGMDRTPPSSRPTRGPFEVSLSDAFDGLERQLEMLGVDSFRYNFEPSARKLDGRPYGNANPSDPSFVLRWEMDGDQYVAACDYYPKLRGNVREVGLWLKEKRMMGNREVATHQSEFANARLPPATEAEQTDPLDGRSPHEVLRISPDVESERIIKVAAQERIKETHPDQGGDANEHEAVKVARERLLGD